MHICKLFVNMVANAIFDVFVDVDGGHFLRKTKSFTATFLFSTMSNTTNFQLHLQYFSHMPHC